MENHLSGGDDRGDQGGGDGTSPSRRQWRQKPGWLLQRGEEWPDSGWSLKVELMGFPDVGCKGNSRGDGSKDVPEKAGGRRGHYLDGRGPRTGQAGENAASVLPTRRPSRDAQLSSR